MKRIAKILPIVLAALMLTACGGAAEEQPASRQIIAMDTAMSFVVYGKAGDAAIQSQSGGSRLQCGEVSGRQLLFGVQQRAVQIQNDQLDVFVGNCVIHNYLITYPVKIWWKNVLLLYSLGGNPVKHCRRGKAETVARSGIYPSTP